jgi:hypothetical protein
LTCISRTVVWLYGYELMTPGFLMPETVLVALQPFNGGNAPITSDACIEAKDNSADKRRCLRRFVPFSGKKRCSCRMKSVIGCWVADRLVSRWSADWPIGLPNANRTCRLWDLSGIQWPTRSLSAVQRPTGCYICNFCITATRFAIIY